MSWLSACPKCGKLVVIRSDRTVVDSPHIMKRLKWLKPRVIPHACDPETPKAALAGSSGRNFVLEVSGMSVSSEYV